MAVAKAQSCNEFDLDRFCLPNWFRFFELRARINLNIWNKIIISAQFKELHTILLCLLFLYIVKRLIFPSITSWIYKAPTFFVKLKFLACCCFGKKKKKLILDSQSSRCVGSPPKLRKYMISGSAWNLSLQINEQNKFSYKRDFEQYARFLGTDSIDT